MSRPIRNGIGVPDLSRAGRAARRKGGAGELEVVKLAHAHGFDQARRVFGSGSAGGGDVAGIPGLYVEVKRTEKCSPWAWIGQAHAGALRTSDTPVVAFRRSNSEWHAIVPLDDLLGWVKVAQS